MYKPPTPDVLVALTEAEVRHIQRLIEKSAIAPPDNTYIGIKMMFAMQTLQEK